MASEDGLLQLSRKTEWDEALPPFPEVHAEVLKARHHASAAKSASSA